MSTTETVIKTSSGQSSMVPATCVAGQFFDDPRIDEARKLILSALEDHRGQITGIRPADPALQGPYAEMIARFGQMRGGNLYFPYLASGIGNGPYVELADGSVKLDFITGIGVQAAGYSDPRIVSAGIDAALHGMVMHGNLQQGTISYEFVDTLLRMTNNSGGRLEHCFLTTSGSMANENALKIVFQKHAPASRVISFERCFAGRTLALTQVTDKAAYREGLPTTLNVDLVPFFDAEDPQGSTLRCVQAIRAHAARFPGQHACLWLELVQGEGGYYPGDTAFFRSIIGEAKKHNMAIVADEIQSFSRTTRPWAFQHFGIDSLIDVAVVGKITQVCATLFTADYKPKPGLISQTFTGSSWALLAGKTILNELDSGGFFGPSGRNMKLHDYFVSGLKKLADKYPGKIRGPFGIGTMIGFTPLAGKAEDAKNVVGKLYELGLMSFMAGANPARVRFLMPHLCVRESHIDEALSIIDRAFGE